MDLFWVGLPTKKEGGTQKLFTKAGEETQEKVYSDRVLTVPWLQLYLLTVHQDVPRYNHIQVCGC